MRLWDAHTFRQLALRQLKGGVKSLAFHPKGLWLACGTSCGDCYILDIASRIRIAQCHEDSAIAAFDPRSMCLAIESPWSSAMIAVTDVKRGRVLVRLGDKSRGFMSDISFSPDGKLVLGAEMETVYIWDASTGTQLFQLRGHASRVLKACFSPCGKYIASGSKDLTIRLWSTHDGHASRRSPSTKTG